LLAQGAFAEAAQAFDHLATAALQHGWPQAARFTLRAAEAYLKAGRIPTARERALHGLEMLANADRWQQLQRAGERVVAALESHGQPALANEVRQALRQWLAAAPPQPRARASLPATCPACGAPVHPEEITWETSRAFCPYCGTPLQ
jgi:NADH pyrophosphatase NudC (nudix superfamily)